MPVLGERTLETKSIRHFVFVFGVKHTATQTFLGFTKFILYESTLIRKSNQY